jgi:hypothetical protein
LVQVIDSPPQMPPADVSFALHMLHADMPPVVPPELPPRTRSTHAVLQGVAHTLQAQSPAALYFFAASALALSKQPT